MGIRTDMAVEAREICAQHTGGELPGVLSDTRQFEFGTVTTVTITTEQAEQAMGKKRGTYVTVESPDLNTRDKEVQERVGQILAEELQKMMNDMGIGPQDTVFVVGLGNWSVTPDALGPSIIENLLITRHIWQLAPPEKRGGLRPVCGLSPGVLGITGIETADTVGAVAREIRPQLVIVIDALASRSLSRVGTSIQTGNTGINPGSGVGNRRFGITRESIGVPVIAIGVPTVVDAITIAADAMEMMSQAMSRPPQNIGVPAGPMTQRLFSAAANPAGVDPATRAMMMRQILQPYIGNLVVTPKDVDVMVEEMAKVVAGGINMALHPGLTEDDLYKYLM